MKGRKPKQDAVRRGLVERYNQAITIESRGVVMPDDIKIDPVQSEIWTLIAPPVNNFIDSDIPALRLLCFWHAAALNAQAQMESVDGYVGVLASTDKGDVVHPALKVLKQASTEIRALSDQLGLSPLARSRIGLLQVATAKTAADTAAMFRSIDGAYGDLT